MWSDISLHKDEDNEEEKNGEEKKKKIPEGQKIYSGAKAVAEGGSSKLKEAAKELDQK